MAEYFIYSTCDDAPRDKITPPKNPSGSGLPDGGEEGQVLTMGADGPTWASGSGSGVTLYNATGQSTTGGMTQKAITDALDNKVDKEANKGLSTNDYTDEEKTKLDSLALIKSIGAGLTLDASTGELTAAGSSEAITALTERIAALEDLLAGYEDTRLQMSDGTNVVDRFALTKNYRPAHSMFDLPYGAYDNEGNLLLGGEAFWATIDLTASPNGEDTSEFHGYVDFNDLPTGTKGVVFPSETLDGREITGIDCTYDYDAFIFNHQDVEWIVLPEKIGYVRPYNMLIGSDAWNGATIYYRGDPQLGRSITPYFATLDDKGIIPWEE